MVLVYLFFLHKNKQNLVLLYLSDLHHAAVAVCAVLAHFCFSPPARTRFPSLFCLHQSRLYRRIASARRSPRLRDFRPLLRELGCRRWAIRGTRAGPKSALYDRRGTAGPCGGCQATRFFLKRRETTHADSRRLPSPGVVCWDE